MQLRRTGPDFGLERSGTRRPESGYSGTRSALRAATAVSSRPLALSPATVSCGFGPTAGLETRSSVEGDRSRGRGLFIGFTREGSEVRASIKRPSDQPTGLPVRWLLEV